MTRSGTSEGPLRVAVTGAKGDLGALLLPLLEADPRVESILALDVVPPQAPGPKVEFRRVDLARHDADAHLGSALQHHRTQALFHLAFLWSPITNAGAAHELEVLGTMHVLAAASACGIGQLIVPSLTAVYGARRENPALLTEDAALHDSPHSRFVRDKVEVERLVRDYRRAHTDVRIAILRFAPILGPSVNNPVTRLLRARVVPTLLGFDPLWQVVHEEDAARALQLALHAGADGEFNVVAPGVLPLSALVHLSGGRAVPLPHPVARGALRLLNATGAFSIPMNLLDFIHFSWVADGRRAEAALGFVPRHDARQAVLAARRR